MSGTQQRYSLWNQRLLETYFNSSMAGTEVWLAIDPDELDAIGADLGGDQGFLKALKAGPEWPVTQLSTGDPRWLGEIVEKLVLQRQVRRSRPPGYICPSSLNPAYGDAFPPTYLPIVAALIRSAAQQDAPGYYDHLQKSLGLPASWGPQQMQGVLRAFEDLESWTEGCGRRFGRFLVRQLGGYRLIGIPRSQCAVPKHDSLLIGRVFARARLRPGARLGDEEFRDLRELISEAQFLTRALRQAANDPDRGFDAPLRDRLQTLLDEWDGYVPIASNPQGGRQRNEQERRSEDDEVRLCLVPYATPDLHWDIGWRLPRVVDEGVVTISHGQVFWTARILGGDIGATTNQSDAIQAEAAAVVLGQAVGIDGHVEFLASASEAPGEESRPIGRLVLKRSVLRILVPVLNGVTRRTELWELPLPNNGPAYLLASAGYRNDVQEYLRRNAIAHQVVPGTGLPRGWELVCITTCETLSPEQRYEIPDGRDDERPASRVIRFTGGRPVQQGGFRKYPAYDLPMVELDAPAGTQLLARGLHLEAVAGELPDGPGASVHQVRVAMGRYRIVVDDEERGTFDIRARDASGRPIGSATLRILANSVGQSSDAGGMNFGMGSMGRPAATFPRLSGIVYREAGRPAEGSLREARDRLIGQEELGHLATASDAAALGRHPVAGFLDSLSLCGSMLYGTARDQISRLSLASGSPIENAALVLLDLRARGHLEIETNHMGRMVRIHAVSPVAYRLPVATKDWIVLGILGTPCLACWGRLADRSMPWYAVESSSGKPNLPVWRLLALDGDADLEAKLAECGLRYAGSSPAASVLGWSCSIDDVRDEARAWGNEQLIGSDTLAERFNPATRSRYVEVRPPHFNHAGPDVQLLRSEDWITRSHRVYSVGIRDEQGIVKFSFMRDSRWGVWLSMVALGRFLTRPDIKIPDGDPWPIPYLRESGTVLVPAPIGLPSMLERALVLCSGEPSQLVSMLGKPSGNEQRLGLHRVQDGARLGSASPAYFDLATGRWLAWRWVPEDVAEVLARKVGGKLDVT